MSEELDEVWGLFAEEGNSSLDEVEERLLQLKNYTGDGDAVAALFRAMHTFKGNARVMGLANIESVAHAAEDLIGLVRDEGATLDEELRVLLLETADHLRQLHEQSAHSRLDVTAEQNELLLARLHTRFEQHGKNDTRPSARQTHASAIAPHEPMLFEPIALDESATDANEEEQQIFGFPEPASATPSEDDTTEAETLADSIAEFQPIPEAEPESVPESIIFDTDAARGSLILDPVYREVFSGLAQDALRDMQSILNQEADTPETSQSFAEEVERLLHAAEQIGLPAWQQLLQDYLAHQHPERDAQESLLAKLHALYQHDLVATPEPDSEPGSESVFDWNPSGASEPKGPHISTDPARRFLDSLAEPLEVLSRRGQHVLGGIATTSDEFNRVVGVIRNLAEAAGFVGVADIMDRRIPGVEPSEITEEIVNAHFNRMEYQLYEELASVAATVLEDREGLELDPQAVLRTWCAEHAFEALFDIREHLEHLGADDDVAHHSQSIRECLRRVYHACQHYQLETAAHLSMSLVDLLARVETGEMNVDAVLIFIIKSFVHDVELILNAADQGEYADLSRMDHIQEAAAEFAFISSGSGSASQIESRLSLPRSFHKVLTPESVHDALMDLAAGYHFYILRADLNKDEMLSERLISWVSSGKAHLISNVTVFVEDYTLFDFLLSTPLSESDIHETIARLDPSGKLLKLEATLTDRKAHSKPASARSALQTGAPGQETGPTTDLTSKDGNTLNAQAMRLIGELVTGQSQLHHLLARLQESELKRDIDQLITQAANDWNSARETVHILLSGHQIALEQLAQIHTQNAALLTQLQEEALSQRVRSAAVLLQPLYAYVETLAASAGRKVALKISGEDETLDFSLLEQLKPVVRKLLEFVIRHSIEPTEQRNANNKPAQGQIKLTLSTHGGHVNLILEDDGLGIDPEQLAAHSQSKATLGMLLNESGKVGANDQYDGMDLAALRQDLRHQGGDLRLANSSLGGLRFSLNLPLATVVLDGMVIRVGEVQYIVPIQAIQRIVRAGAHELTQVSANQGDYLLCMENEKVLPIQFLRRSGQAQTEEGKAQLAALLDNREKKIEDELKHLFVVVGEHGQSAALAVDELIGQQQVLIRPLQGYLSSIRGATGCALLGSGDVGIVLDMGALLDQAEAEVA